MLRLLKRLFGPRDDSRTADQASANSVPDLDATGKLGCIAEALIPFFQKYWSSAPTSATNSIAKASSWLNGVADGTESPDTWGRVWDGIFMAAYAADESAGPPYSSNIADYVKTCVHAVHEENSEEILSLISRGKSLVDNFKPHSAVSDADLQQLRSKVAAVIDSR